MRCGFRIILYKDLLKYLFSQKQIRDNLEARQREQQEWENEQGFGQVHQFEVIFTLCCCNQRRTLLKESCSYLLFAAASSFVCSRLSSVAPRVDGLLVEPQETETRRLEIGLHDL